MFRCGGVACFSTPARVRVKRGAVLLPDERNALNDAIVDASVGFLLGFVIWNIGIWWFWGEGIESADTVQLEGKEGEVWQGHRLHTPKQHGRR